ncbi:hypothetical protein GCM10010387_46100 [Streptomyces inusitatus]|uniref:Uncharacterized protein n=1 Tax=Streptomyces inusitatus TaxID=68221 RepID=A0A918V006_9ACTN|nr:hypothetical protein GCM10010387_46100 [Streptomyces inusitatus]
MRPILAHAPPPGRAVGTDPGGGRNRIHPPETGFGPWEPANYGAAGARGTPGAWKHSHGAHGLPRARAPSPRYGHHDGPRRE